MRINRYVANASGLSRRHADKLITDGLVKIDGHVARTGQNVNEGQQVSLDDKILVQPATTSLLLNKPTGYIVSRNGQGAPTIYSLLPKSNSALKPIGRLDKDSSGLLLLSNNGQFIQSMSHPSFSKKKVYEVILDKELTDHHKQLVAKGVQLEDGLSKLDLLETNGKHLVLSMEEGRNRQIRRTFRALGYRVIGLNRTAFGKYSLGILKPGEYQEVMT